MKRNRKKNNKIRTRKKEDNLADRAARLEGDGSRLQLGTLRLLVPLRVPPLRLDLLLPPRHPPSRSLSLCLSLSL